MCSGLLQPPAGPVQRGTAHAGLRTRHLNVACRHPAGGVPVSARPHVRPAATRSRVQAGCVCPPDSTGPSFHHVSSMILQCCSLRDRIECLSTIAPRAWRRLSAPPLRVNRIPENQPTAAFLPLNRDPGWPQHRDDVVQIPARRLRNDRLSQGLHRVVTDSRDWFVAVRPGLRWGGAGRAVSVSSVLSVTDRPARKSVTECHR